MPKMRVRRTIPKYLMKVLCDFGCPMRLTSFDNLTQKTRCRIRIWPDWLITTLTYSVLVAQAIQFSNWDVLLLFQNWCVFGLLLAQFIRKVADTKTCIKMHGPKSSNRKNVWAEKRWRFCQRNKWIDEWHSIWSNFTKWQTTNNPFAGGKCKQCTMADDPTVITSIANRHQQRTIFLQNADNLHSDAVRMDKKMHPKNHAFYYKCSAYFRAEQPIWIDGVCV